MIAYVVSLRRLFKKQIFQVLCIELIAFLRRRLTSTIRAAFILAPIPNILVVVEDLTSLEIEEVEESRGGQEIDQRDEKLGEKDAEEVVAISVAQGRVVPEQGIVKDVAEAMQEIQDHKSHAPSNDELIKEGESLLSFF
jgi:hypothetical protein